MTRQHILAESIRDSGLLLVRNLKGFDDSNHTKQAAGLPNHVAWQLGHLAQTMNRMAEKFDGKPMPESDFVKGNAERGADRFDTDSVGFNSQPVADPTMYPDCARCISIFDAAIERFAAAVANSDDAKLDSPAKWAKGEVPMWSVASRMAFHNGVHCGQIVDLRRALGLGTILG